MTILLKNKILIPHPSIQFWIVDHKKISFFCVFGVFGQKPQKTPKTHFSQKVRKSEFWCIKGATKQRSFLSTPPHLISL